MAVGFKAEAIKDEVNNNKYVIRDMLYDVSVVMVLDLFSF